MKAGIHILAGRNNNTGMAMSEARTLQCIYEAGCTRGMEKISYWGASSPALNVIKPRRSEKDEAWKRWEVH